MNLVLEMEIGADVRSNFNAKRRLDCFRGLSNTNIVTKHFLVSKKGEAEWINVEKSGMNHD